MRRFQDVSIPSHSPVHLPGVGLASSRRNNSDYSLVKELLYRSGFDISCVCNFRLIRFGAANHMDRFAVVNGSEILFPGPFCPASLPTWEGERYRLIRPCQRPSLLSVKKARRRRRVVVRRTRTSYERETFGRPTVNTHSPQAGLTRTYKNCTSAGGLGSLDRFDFCLSRRSGERF